MAMLKPKAVIIDYGMGNLFSIKRVLECLGRDAVISSEPQAILSAERVILPGVGAFGDGVSNLKIKGLVEPIKEFARSGKPFLGICLGMQLLMGESEEFGLYKGLGLIPGRVKRFPDSSKGDSYKIPHVGWNSIMAPEGAGGNCYWKDTILDKVSEGAFVYFVHSYAAIPEFQKHILSETSYGGNRFCSAVRLNNLTGCQFHPEISGQVGLRIIREFLEMPLVNVTSKK